MVGSRFTSAAHGVMWKSKDYLDETLK